MTYSCLIIERNGELARDVAVQFPACGVRPYTAPTYDAAMDLLGQRSFDSALIDGDGFGQDCIDVLHRLRACFRNPVILLSKPQDERTQILNLESGATEVVIKPTSPKLLATRMRCLIDVVQQKAEATPEPVRFGPLAMHGASGIATVDDVPIPLTAHQFELLFLLASRAGQYVDRETIALRLRGPDAVLGRSTDVLVYRIRRKLRQHGIERLQLDTVHGRGYLLTLDAAEPANAADAADTLRLNVPRRRLRRT